MAAIDLKAATPDTSLPSTGFLFGADSQVAATPSIYPVANVKETMFADTPVFVASVTGGASFRVPHGVAPTSPTNGDFWTTTASINMRVNGSTVTLADLESAQTISGVKTFGAGKLVGTDLYSGANKVVGARVTGWGTPSGTLDRTTLAAYAGQTASAGYVQAEAQATDDAVKKVSQVLAALITDLRAHGLIGS